MKKIGMNIKNVAGKVVIALLASILAVFFYVKFFQKEPKVITQNVPVSFVNLPEITDSNQFNFIVAAEKTVHAVVHVKTTSKVERAYNPLYEFFYGESDRDPQPVMGFGSGVIISKDGYIVTNNHVIDGADEISVKLNDNREYDAELIGADPQTDIALLKIKGENLHAVPIGNSDKLRVGEWVLAVGNPYNLTSTVTAGIVSAKGRNLGILNDRYRIEAFIQTDAALNRGNSGGALVNIKGQLVGVNTAIISPSGAYAGNSFAVPVNIVKKVVEDLIEYGEVQRAILGVTIQDVTAELAEEENLDDIKGVYISGVREGGAADEAGIKKGDVVLKVDEVEVNSTSELQEQISRHRPSDKVTIELIRDNKKKLFEVTLRNMYGDTGIVNSTDRMTFLGARFDELETNEKERLGLEGGVKVSKLEEGKIKSAGIKEGFVITRINNEPVSTVADVKRIIESIDGGVYIEGVDERGMKHYYAFGM